VLRLVLSSTARPVPEDTKTPPGARATAGCTACGSASPMPAAAPDTWCGTPSWQLALFADGANTAKQHVIARAARSHDRPSASAAPRPKRSPSPSVSLPCAASAASPPGAKTQHDVVGSRGQHAGGSSSPGGRPRQFDTTNRTPRRRSGSICGGARQRVHRRGARGGGQQLHGEDDGRFCACTVHDKGLRRRVHAAAGGRDTLAMVGVRDVARWRKQQGQAGGCGGGRCDPTAAMEPYEQYDCHHLHAG
jgi:hypothetical protein